MGAWILKNLKNECEQIGNLDIKKCDKLDPEKIDNIITSAKFASKLCTANVQLLNSVFYMPVWVDIFPPIGNYEFQGNAGGVSSLVALVTGDLYTDDVTRLVNDTKSFMVTAYIAYVAVYFYDSHTNLLGNVQAGGVSIGSIGGGTGKWSKKP